MKRVDWKRLEKSKQELFSGISRMLEEVPRRSREQKVPIAEAWPVWCVNYSEAS